MPADFCLLGECNEARLCRLELFVFQGKKKVGFKYLLGVILDASGRGGPRLRQRERNREMA